jgi:tRNA G46 methylase TrmB
MDWSTYYPAFVAPEQSAQQGADTITAPEDGAPSIPKIVKDVEVADIGCGYGGLLVALAPKLPEKLLLGERDYQAKLSDII